MDKLELNEVDDIFKFFNKYRKSTRYLFRGQSNSTWSLIPKAGRPSFSKRGDEELFKQWKRRAFAYIDNKGLSDVELLTVAQHTGLPTRLLDWTFNPLVAVFFACVENQETDGAIFVCRPKHLHSIHTLDKPFSYKAGKVYMLQPNSSHSRLINQFGYFTLHCGPSIELDKKTSGYSLEKIIIPKSLKKELVFVINQLGVNNMTIFPDLDGLSKHLCWFYENYDYWTETIDNVPFPPLE